MNFKKTAGEESSFLENILLTAALFSCLPQFEPQIDLSQLADTIMYHGLMATGDPMLAGEGPLSLQLDLESDLDLQQLLTFRMLQTLAERRHFLLEEVNASARERRGFNWDRFVPSMSWTTEGMVRSWEESDSSRAFGAGDVLEYKEDNFYERLVQTDSFFKRRRVLGARARQIWKALSTAGDKITSAESKLTVGDDGVENFRRWSVSGDGERERERRLFDAVSLSDGEFDSSDAEQSTEGNEAAGSKSPLVKLGLSIPSEGSECLVPSEGWDVQSCWRCPSQCWQAIVKSYK